MSGHSRGLPAMSQTCQPRQWYRVSRTSKIKTPLPDYVCERLDFAREEIDESIVEMETEGEVWVYKIKDLKCYSNSNKHVKYGLENYGKKIVGVGIKLSALIVHYTLLNVVSF
jgi:hypothetical protein